MMKKEALKAGVLNALHGVDPKTATPQQLHQALGETVMEAIAPDWKKSMDAHEHSRRACYFSMEFLVGRAVYNNLLVLDVMQEAEEAFAELGVSLSDLEVIEDAALGNGGLGRLAACFLDSAATLDLPLDGYGIRYKYGLFKQYFEDGCQKEVPDDWMRYGDAWSVRREEDAVLVEFAGQTVRAVPYDMPVIGCKTKHIGNLRLWQAEPVHTFDFDLFNQQKYLEAAAETVYAEDISRVLYPNDDTWEGKKLRLKQQYFFCAASLQDILKKHKAAYGRQAGDPAERYPSGHLCTGTGASADAAGKRIYIRAGVRYGTADLPLHQSYRHAGSTGKMGLQSGAAAAAGSL